MENAAKKGRRRLGLLQSEDLYQYILNTSVYPREPEPLKELRDITAKHPRSVIATTPDAGQFMSLLLKLLNPKKTIELGVFTGYSLLLTALSIPEDGKIVAIDKNREAYEMGLPVVKKAGVEHKIEFVESQALDALDKLLEEPENEGSFDFAYVDADKSNQLNYHESLMKLIKLGGVVIYDNTLWGGTVALPDPSSAPEGRKADWQSTLDFNNALAADSRVDITQVALGDGITICKRIC